MRGDRTFVGGIAAVGMLLLSACSSGNSPAMEATGSTLVRRTTTTSTSTTTTAPPTTVATVVTIPPTTVPPVPVTLAPVVAGSRPHPAHDPVALAAQINEAEAAIRDPAASAEVVDAAGRLAQVAYRFLADHPELDAAVQAAVDPAFHNSFLLNTWARREFRAMHVTLSDTLPAWRIVEPLPADHLMALYQEAEATFGVPWYILAAVNLVETGMGRIQGLSVAGAQGPMQFMPGTWEAYGMGGDVNDPHDAIMGAANYLAANGGAEGTDERLDNALFRYNNSNRYVRGVRQYADVMRAEPITFRGFHAWEIVYLTVAGDVVLETGYESAERISVHDYLLTHPQ